jgi:hypothetical protein
VKRKIGRGKKRKNRTEFLNRTSGTHAKKIKFRFISLKSEKISEKLAQPFPNPKFLV